MDRTAREFAFSTLAVTHPYPLGGVRGWREEKATKATRRVT